MAFSEKSGVVYLVGAGPGDPGLLTVRGAELLDAADVVVYDSLINPALLSYCPRAELIFVGKRAANHAMPQTQINELLVAKGLAGKRVVRLKGGDPFVFGRGGEECEALSASGVRFEVVPGITAAIAAAAYAGIPATHRNLNSSFTFITGHEKEENYRDEQAIARDAAGDKAEAGDLDYAALAKLPAIAFYMGVKSLPRICRRLIDHGMPADTPAATIQWGTLPSQRTVTATVSTIAEAASAAKIGAPAITLIGQVVKLRETLGWFENRPLFGKRIVVTRTRQQASELSQQLRELGAEVLEAPTIELAEPADFGAVDAALKSAGAYDWIVFTSANGVVAAKNRLMRLGLDVRALWAAKIAAIGDATAAAVQRELCLRVDLCPESFVAEALADELIARGEAKAGKRFLLLRADIARPILREKLLEAGAKVDDVAVYETRRPVELPENVIEAIRQGRVDWITFTSSSTAKNFSELLPADARNLIAGINRVSIGPVTTQTLAALGWNPTIEARIYNVSGVVDAIIAFETQKSDK